MLILKEPIKLRSLFPMVPLTDGFFERIDANYKQLQAKYNTEELFYLLNQSPESYSEEDGMTTIVTQNRNERNQEVRLEMVYNLFNRLMMSDSSDFTYQDTVFVHNMLEKLGVRNVSEFMKQLYEIQQDTKNTKQLLNIYRNHTETLRTMIESVNMQEEKEGKKDNTDNHTFPVYWMHNEIFKRLQTGNVYHTVAAFQKDKVHYQSSIGTGEIEMAGQIHTSEALELRSLENKILMSENTLLEHRVNIYEEGTEEGSGEKEQIIHELAQAVLLNIAGNLYQSGSERRVSGKNLWYRFEGEFHQVLEDTFNRFSKYHFHDIREARHSTPNLYQHNVNELRKEKILKLHNILEVSEKKDIKNIASEEKFVNIESLKENVYLSDEENMVNRKAVERKFLEETLKTERQREESIQRITADEEFQILNEINRTNRSLEHHAESLEKDREQEKRLIEELRLLNEENRRKLEETEKKEEVYQKTLPVQIDKKRTRQETLLLLSHPELFEEYTEETTVSLPEVERRLKETEIEITKRLLGESTEQIENLVKEEERLHRKYSESIKQTGKSIRQHRSEEVREQLTEEVQQYLTEEVSKLPEMRKTVLTYLDMVSREKIEEEFYQNKKYVTEEQQIESMNEAFLHLRQNNLQETVEQLKKKGELNVFRRQRQQPSVAKRSVPLYHKETDTLTTEMPERSTAPTRVSERTEELISQKITGKIATDQQIHQQMSRPVKKESEHITEMINKGVQRQLNTISEQVYHKLEKKLSNDRRRRGY